MERPILISGLRGILSRYDEPEFDSFRMSVSLDVFAAGHEVCSSIDMFLDFEA